MPWVLRGRVLRCPAAAGGWRRLGAVVSGIFIQFPGAGMVPRELRLARVRRTAWDAGGVPGRCCGCCRVFFPQYSWVLGLVSPSLPPSDSFSFASPCLQLHVTRFLGEQAGVTPLQQGGQAGGPSPGATSWGGGRVAPFSRLRRALEGNLSTESMLVLLRRARSRELSVSAPRSIRTGGRARCSRRRAGLARCPLPSSPGHPLSLFNNLECIGCKKS